MMDMNFEEMYKKFSLTAMKSEEIQLDIQQLQDSVLCSEKCLVAKLFTEHHYNWAAFKSTMKRAWRSIRDIKFRDLNSMIMLIEFEHECDKDRVITDGPWSFDKHLVLVNKFDGYQQVH